MRKRSKELSVLEAEQLKKRDQCEEESYAMMQ
jgi:hypothetical protein